MLSSIKCIFVWFFLIKTFSDVQVVRFSISSPQPNRTLFEISPAARERRLRAELVFSVRLLREAPQARGDIQVNEQEYKPRPEAANHGSAWWQLQSTLARSDGRRRGPERP